MTSSRTAGGLLVVGLLGAACGGRSKDDGTIRLAGPSTPVPPGDPVQPPVAVNPVSPIDYPLPLLEQGIQGRVLLRLYADSQGTIIPDSTRIAESSGYPALDSAALRGAAGLRYSPALRRGRPVAGLFLQPVTFRSPRNGSANP